MAQKDRQQKAAALKYAVSRRWFPQLELDVSTFLTTREQSLAVTDIDVFASVPDEFLGFRGYLIDCKTKRGESPINRALWMRGLMARLSVSQGLCVLKIGDIESDHRYTAAKLGVHLVAEHEFDAFATATSPNWLSSDSPAVSRVDLWDRFFRIADRYPRLGGAIRFSKSRYWMATDAAEACRQSISIAKQISGELDPSKPEHFAVATDLTALFSHALGQLVSYVFAAYLQPAKKQELSEALMLLFYGGRDSYEQRNRLKTILSAVSQHVKDEPLSIPEADLFVDLARQGLDAPIQLLHAPLLLREAAWSMLSGQSAPSPLMREIAARHKHAVRLAVLASDYLRKAGQQPPELSSQLTNLLLESTVPAKQARVD